MDLTQTKTKRIGGYNRIQIVKSDEITSFPNVGSSSSLSADSISTTSGWTNLELTPGSVKVSLKPSRGAGGKIITAEISGLFPDDDPNSLDILKKFDQRRCLVRIRGNNNQEKLYGTKNNPLRFSYVPAENQKTTDQVGYQVQLSGILLNDPVFII